MKNIRLRFAPSPTGFLHIGSLRTVLFTYAIVKKMEGKFILRIEDTDQKREVEGATEELIKSLEKFNINFDEGPHVGGDFGPYIQTQRLEIYNKHLKDLLAKGEAYHCFCTPERLGKMRADQAANKQAPRYDRACRDLSPEIVEAKIKTGEKFVIRQKMPLDGVVKVFDEIRGEIIYKAQDLDDHVLIKSDGVPTYQFASVVDDHEMEISHVTRAEEWIPSLPKNILLYQSFGWEPPKFIHYPAVLSKNGGKLSKRDGDVAVEDYLNKGYLVEAIINFCILLGWHPKDDNEILSMSEIIEKFDYKDIRPSGSIFDVEKLDYFNGYYIRQKSLDELAELCKPYLEENLAKTSDKKQQTKEYLKNVVRLEQERLKKLSEIGERTEYFFTDKLEYDAKLLVWKKSTPEQTKENFDQVYKVLEKIPDDSWTNNSIGDALMSHIQAVGGKNGDYLWPMRAALTGREASPGPFDVAEVLGKEKSLERIKEGLERLS
ncbi:MAG: glutamate--tRNA ligase [Patescibacteria group bacterium]|nr:glutamate--tRNA ligase [Patescibacteria group bacterium]MDD4610341.1 glutamate--tRNA ligase [Patescibacteria group bacterium]